MSNAKESKYYNISRNDVRRQEFNKKTVAELKEICREREIRGYSHKRKSEIIELIVKDTTHCAFCEQRKCICCPECGGTECDWMNGHCISLEEEDEEEEDE